MKWLVDWVVKKFLIDIVIGWIDKALGALPGNEQKTLVGIAVMIAVELVKQLPETGPYVGPLLEHLQTLPADQLQAGGFGLMVVGLAHKLIKWVVDKFGNIDSTGKQKG